MEEFACISHEARENKVTIKKVEEKRDEREEKICGETKKKQGEVCR